MHKYYKVIDFPIPLNIDRYSLDVEKNAEFYEWFLRVKEERLQYFLKTVIQSSLGDITESQINACEEYMLSNCDFERLSETELLHLYESIPEHLKSVVKLSEIKLDFKSLCICFDSSIFLGELLMSMDKKIKWELQKDIDYVNYGYPVLIKKSCKAVICPYSVVVNLASTIIESSYRRGKLESVFRAWKEIYKIG